MEKAGFGGGCHWCTEAVFAALRGVVHVEQGFIRADAPDDGWSEAVRVTFDPEGITLDVLVEVHLRTHASTSDHSMRGKYRSAVYATSDAQRAEAADILQALAPQFDAPLVTRALTLRGFRPSPERFRNYFEKQAGGPFCTRYIDLKLARLRKHHAAQMRAG